MLKKYKLILVALVFVFLAGLVAKASLAGDLALLAPKGDIALKERDLMIASTLLMLIIVVPVFVLTFVFAWRYREGNHKAKYTPSYDRSGILEFLWWLIPLIIISVISVIAWQSSHALDPFKKIDSEIKPVRIQVIALQWKWLFIYPEENIASVNYIQFPADTPINFEITADAPMNSFWIPKLGGQIYAMSGMSTKLHLIANEAGEYQGSSANISGAGFAGMRFVARASNISDYKTWLSETRQASKILDEAEYNRLVKPSKDEPPAYYSFSQPNLYNYVIGRYLAPNNKSHTHPLEEAYE